MAKGNRKAAEDWLFKFLKELKAHPCNEQIYQELFARLTDAEFDEFMNDLGSGKRTLVLTEPNMQGSRITVENNIAVAKRVFKHDFFQKLWITDDDGFEYQTPIPFMVLDLPWRRASQTRVKKNSIPPHSRTIDAMTGQVTGDSKGAAVSYPELQLCLAMGMEKSMQELMRTRGGDVRANAAMKAFLSKYGRVTQEALAPYGTGATVTRMVKAYLTAMHLRNNL